MSVYSIVVVPKQFAVVRFDSDVPMPTEIGRFDSEVAARVLLDEMRELDGGDDDSGAEN